MCRTWNGAMRCAYCTLRLIAAELAADFIMEPGQCSGCEVAEYADHTLLMQAVEPGTAQPTGLGQHTVLEIAAIQGHSVGMARLRGNGDDQKIAIGVRVAQQQHWAAFVRGQIGKRNRSGNGIRTTSPR